MRITKVTVSKKNVAIKRNAQEGYLLVGEDEKKGDEIKAFIKSKSESFNLSILNKTLEKKVPVKFKTDAQGRYIKNNGKKVKDYAIPENYKALKILFEYILDLADKPKPDCFSLHDIKAQDDLKIYFAHKFTSINPLQYYASKEAKRSNAEKKTVDLLAMLHEAVANSQTKTFEEMKIILQPYKEWANWYTANKQTLLAKSIVKNNIAYETSDSETSDSDSSSSTLSNRKKALTEWAQQKLPPNGGIDFGSLKRAFKLKKLADSWKKIWADEEKYTKEDVQRAKETWRQNKVKSKPSLPKNIFEFMRKLKLALQKHQKELLGELQADPKLNQYSLEVSKYLALYFPLKTSGKKKSFTADYIKYYLKSSIIERVVQGKIENAVTQHLMQHGKALTYAIENATATSESLQKNKITETFALKFINACAFATNNLRNCIDKEQTRDIL